MDPYLNAKKSVCVTCLSRNRTLFLANEVVHLKKVFPDLMFGQYDKICWECKAMAKKVIEFKNRTYKAQLLFFEMVQDGNLNSIQSLSDLTKLDFKVITCSDCTREEYDLTTCKVETPIKVEHDYIDLGLLIEPITPKVEVPVPFELPKLQVKNLSEAGPSTFEDCMSLVKRDQPELLNDEEKTEVIKLDSKYKIIHLSDYDPKTGKRFSEFVKETMVTRSELENLRMNKLKSQKCAYKCLTCMETFKSNDELGEHNYKHSDKAGKFTCSICKQRMLTKKRLHEHTIMHFRCFECLVCAFKSLDFITVLKHYDHCHRTQALECDKCGVKLQTTKDLKLHRRTHKETKDCPECGKTYKNSDTLKVHMMMTHKDTPSVDCPICQKTLRGARYLKQHMATHNNQVDEAAFCAKCCIQFKSVQIYRNHLKTSVKHVSPEDMRFKCPDCDKRCGTAGLLRSHMLVHSSDANYKCDICNKAYRTARRYREHFSVKHEGKVLPKNKVCDICSKAFNNKATLQQHLNSHYGRRPYVCDVCSDTFSFSGALYTHKKLKHGKKPARDKE